LGNDSDGLFVQQNSPVIIYNEISDNQGDGIESHGNPLVNNNNIIGNNDYAFNASSVSALTIDASNNYWGTIDSSEIALIVNDYYDNGTSDKVSFVPFLNSEVDISSLDFAPNDTVCIGESIPPLTAPGNNVNWYSDSEYTILVHTGNSFNTSETDIGVYTYFVTQTLEDDIILKDTATLIISSIPVVNSVEKTNETTCNINDGTITISASDGNQLYYSINSGASFQDNSGIYTGLGNGNYPVVVENSFGCKQSGGTVEIISEGVIPSSPLAGKDTTYCPGVQIKDIFATSSSGGTLTWYSDPGLTTIIGTGGSYSPGTLSESTSFYVTETSDGCEGPSTQVSIEIRTGIVYEGEEICIVTIDQLDGWNLIVWEKTPNQGTAYYKVWREGTLLTTQPYNNLSVFRDTGADPETRPFLYYLSAVDSCGNESGLSPYHKPFFLQYGGTTDGVNLNWSEYLIEEGAIGFTSYSIYRGSDSTSLTPLAENIPTIIGEYKDNSVESLQQGYYYRIAGELITPCSPSSETKSASESYSNALSNLDNNRLVSTNVENYYDSDELLIYPNPASGSVTIQFSNLERRPHKLSILDGLGRTVFQKDNIVEEKILFQKGDLPVGLYFVRLIGPRILQGKIVFE